ncbi:ATP-dependent RecD-like DNA helicase [Mycoplasma marinum]|uniref:UvrD-like helicase C-terminal domain-containing protein n=1 Tax=Mycoplasma marinum TaxID=1937190 RepID=A0A4R0XKL9_9MOLU|nr:ATP-dependent RecD-like DNA helicase [Mycoplasma marinum]TCG11183.1 hypothetical protein C4B24_02775 [Mycoplasma marinum]
MSIEKWNEWLKKINFEKTSNWIKKENIENGEVILSPYNLFKIESPFYVFMSEEGETYYVKSLKWDKLFDKNGEPKNAKFYFWSNKIYTHGYKLSSTSKKTKKSNEPNSNKINSPELQEKLVDWIAHIERENLTQNLEENSLEHGSILEYSPFQFKEVKDNRLYLRTHGMMEVYIPIFMIAFYNNGLKKQLEEGTNSTKYLAKLKTEENTYRLISKTAFQRLETNASGEQKTKEIKIDNQQKSHTNNIWGVESNSNFLSFDLDTSQKEAHDKSIDNKFSIINGYAGTGKSVVVKMISNTLEADGWIVSRLSPTGRAAQLINGKTIHSWLEPIVKKVSNGQFEMDGFSKTMMEEKECLIIDEASMIDNEIWHEIIRVWNNSKTIIDKKIILVGDEGQLEPVGDGTPFLDYINKDTTPITNLKILHRNKDNAKMSIFAEEVRKNGRINRSQATDSIVFITEEEAVDKVINESLQMITPKRNGYIGSLEINRKIKNKMHKDDLEPVFFTYIWQQKPQSSYWDRVPDTPVHINDKIIVIKNMWEWNITNGTTGIFIGEEKIKLYNHGTKQYSKNKMCYKFMNPETKKIFYLPQNINTKIKLELAYAITIHKAQGSEYDSLILFLNGQFVNKKMLYTAVTRAKKLLYIVP